MDCKKCAARIPDGSLYCNHCGARQTAAPRKVRSRGNGQGSAIKRGSTWTAVWTESRYIGDDEKIHYKRRWKGGFATKTAALNYAAHPDADRPEVPTLRDYYRAWDKSKAPKLSDSKQTAYKIAWGKLEFLADRPIDTLSIEDLQDACTLKGKTYYPARDMRTLLSHLYKMAIAEEKVRTNLPEYVELPALEEKELQPFSEEELRALWASYGAGDTIVGYILTMIYSGMMPGELLRLEASMIDYDAKEIRGCGLKTKKRKETPIVFPDLLAPVLLDLSSRSESRLGRVLCMNKDAFYKEYYAALARAGCRKLPPYSCRHTTATALALGNIAPSVIQEVMRHTKFTTTQRYIHPDAAASHAAINTLLAGPVSESANNDANSSKTAAPSGTNA